VKLDSPRIQDIPALFIPVSRCAARFAVNAPRTRCFRDGFTAGCASASLTYSQSRTEELNNSIHITGRSIPDAIDAKRVAQAHEPSGLEATMSKRHAGTRSVRLARQIRAATVSLQRLCAPTLLTAQPQCWLMHAHFDEHGRVVALAHHGIELV
jgi:hypothetical protein